MYSCFHTASHEVPQVLMWYDEWRESLLTAAQIEEACKQSPLLLYKQVFHCNHGAAALVFVVAASFTHTHILKYQCLYVQ